MFFNKIIHKHRPYLFLICGLFVVIVQWLAINNQMYAQSTGATNEQGGSQNDGEGNDQGGDLDDECDGLSNDDAELDRSDPAFERCFMLLCMKLGNTESSCRCMLNPDSAVCTIPVPSVPCTSACGFDVHGRCIECDPGPPNPCEGLGCKHGCDEEKSECNNEGGNGDSCLNPPCNGDPENPGPPTLPCQGSDCPTVIDPIPIKSFSEYNVDILWVLDGGSNIKTLKNVMNYITDQFIMRQNDGYNVSLRMGIVDNNASKKVKNKTTYKEINKKLSHSFKEPLKAYNTPCRGGSATRTLSYSLAWFTHKDKRADLFYRQTNDLSDSRRIMVFSASDDSKKYKKKCRGFFGCFFKFLFIILVIAVFPAGILGLTTLTQVLFGAAFVSGIIAAFSGSYTDHYEKLCKMAQQNKYQQHPKASMFLDVVAMNASSLYLDEDKDKENDEKKMVLKMRSEKFYNFEVWTFGSHLRYANYGAVQNYPKIDDSFSVGDIDHIAKSFFADKESSSCTIKENNKNFIEVDLVTSSYIDKDKNKSYYNYTRHKIDNIQNFNIIREESGDNMDLLRYFVCYGSKDSFMRRMIKNKNFIKINRKSVIKDKTEDDLKDIYLDHAIYHLMNKFHYCKHIGKINYPEFTMCTYNRYDKSNFIKVNRKVAENIIGTNKGVDLPSDKNKKLNLLKELVNNENNFKTYIEDNIPDVSSFKSQDNDSDEDKCEYDVEIYGDGDDLESATNKVYYTKKNKYGIKFCQKKYKYFIDRVTVKDNQGSKNFERVGHMGYGSDEKLLDGERLYLFNALKTSQNRFDHTKYAYNPNKECPKNLVDLKTCHRNNRSSRKRRRKECIAMRDELYHYRDELYHCINAHRLKNYLINTQKNIRKKAVNFSCGVSYRVEEKQAPDGYNKCNQTFANMAEKRHRIFLSNKEPESIGFYGSYGKCSSKRKAKEYKEISKKTGGLTFNLCSSYEHYIVDKIAQTLTSKESVHFNSIQAIKVENRIKQGPATKVIKSIMLVDKHNKHFSVHECIKKHLVILGKYRNKVLLPHRLGYKKIMEIKKDDNCREPYLEFMQKFAQAKSIKIEYLSAN